MLDVSKMTDAEVYATKFLWRELWARPEQIEPALFDERTGLPWRTWMYLAGRGAGKTRTAAEWVNEQARDPNARIALIGRTIPDVRETMVRGESGILACSPPWFRPTFKVRTLRWPNGALATTFTAEKPDQLRGPQFTHGWGDEVAAWRYPEAWDQLQFGLRLGKHPRAVVTTTPRAIPLVRQLVSDVTTRVTRGRTMDNASNLSADFLRVMLAKYQGTRLGRQELEAEILDDNPGALWSRGVIEAKRRKKLDENGKLIGLPDFRRIVIAVDPAVTANPESDETGIVCAATAQCGCRGKPEDHMFVLEDYSKQYKPAEWASVVAKAYYVKHADRVIGEVNNGGDLVESNIRTAEREDRAISYKAVRATRGKIVRAEPVAALYEQGKVHHVGMFAELEDEMCTYDPTSGQRSPSRMDALVWAATELMLGNTAQPYTSTVGAAPDR